MGKGFKNGIGGEGIQPLFKEFLNRPPSTLYYLFAKG